jgi:hypothetical protein
MERSAFTEIGNLNKKLVYRSIYTYISLIYECCWNNSSAGNGEVGEIMAPFIINYSNKLLTAPS